MKIISMLPWADWLALISFFGLWVGYAWVAKVRGLHEHSLIATTNLYRIKWMLQATTRDPRMLDGHSALEILRHAAGSALGPLLPEASWERARAPAKRGGVRPIPA